MLGMGQVHARMDADEALYNLEEFVPDFEESIAPEDAYTTNAPRVLAEKTIAFIAGSETIVRTFGSEKAVQQQESANDLVEQLAIGMLNNANRRLRRKGAGFAIHETLGWYASVRGRWAAARAVLRKRPNGETYDDILPLDPRHLVIQPGDEEPVWAAYRMRKTKTAVLDEYPNFKFEETKNSADWDRMDGDDSLDVFEYYTRVPNPLHDASSKDPFDRHPWVYLAGTVIDGVWARPLHNLWMLSFPVVAIPVTSRPMLTPGSGAGEQESEAHFGESVFAENRSIWKKLNRTASYVLDLTGKSSDPRKKVFSLDGTKELDDGTNDKGSELNLSTANQEDVQLFQEADVNRAAGLLLQILQQDAVAGGLPPQAFGIIDLPLSSVALRTLGNNLEQRVLPRMRAVAACIEGCLENLILQYETGAFAPISVSGRRFDNSKFSNRVIEPSDIEGHDPVTVKMDLLLPEDETTRWTIAQMAMAPTVSGEPLASLEWVRERVLKMESARAISSQNREDSGKVEDPLSAALEHFNAFVRDGDMANASIWFDKLTALSLQRQVETNALITQLRDLARQAGFSPRQFAERPRFDKSGIAQRMSNLPSTVSDGSTLSGGSLTNQAAGFTERNRRFGNNQSLNPANGAIPFAQAAGVGNEPTLDAAALAAIQRRRRERGTA